jgi:Na+/melibiose symporter-like transporter
LAVAYGIPIIVRTFSPDGKINSAESGNAWFITMTIYALAGLALLIFCYTQTKNGRHGRERYGTRKSIRSMDGICT